MDSRVMSAQRLGEKFPFPNSANWEIGATDRVAIITRTKDRPVLLARAFASVLSQTHSNWHLYLINDGGDQRAIDALVSQHEHAFGGRISVTRNEISLGMEAASNIGLAQARGAADFMVVHDDDDSWNPNFLRKTTLFLREPKNEKYCAVAAKPMVVVERIEGNRVIEYAWEDWSFWRPMMDFASLLSRNAIPPICLLIRMQAAEQIGEYNSDLPVLGDWDYLLRLLTISDVATIEETLAYYHQRRDAGGRYGNSVHFGYGKHQIYDVLYRNSLVRKAIQEDQSNIGVLQVILRSIDESERKIIERLDRIEDRLGRFEWFSRGVWTARDIAREVWFERQRWQLPYKLLNWFRARKESPRPSTNGSANAPEQPHQAVERRG